jgi:hypothetical protein
MSYGGDVTTYISREDFMINKGATALSYEPFDPQYAYYDGTLQSLQNGTNDEVSPTGGWEKIKTKEYALQASDITGVNISGTNVGRVIIANPSDALPFTTDGDMVEVPGMIKTTSVTWDNVSFIGSYYVENGAIIFIVDRGWSTEQAQTALVGKELSYQCAVETITNITPQIITAGAGDTFIWLPHIKFEQKPTAGVFTIPDETIPIKSVVSVKKFVDGIPDTLATVSANDTTTITIDSPDNDAVYEVIYEYDTSLTTIPSIVVEYANNFKAQTENNTVAIQLNSKTLNDFMAYQNAINLLFDMRLTALEP